jgi:hypothetical protein
MWRLDQVTFTWLTFSVIPSWWRLGETPNHGPGWAVSWLGFSASFEQMIDTGLQFIPWKKGGA